MSVEELQQLSDDEIESLTDEQLQEIANRPAPIATVTPTFTARPTTTGEVYRSYLGQPLTGLAFGLTSGYIPEEQYIEENRRAPGRFAELAGSLLAARFGLRAFPSGGAVATAGTSAAGALGGMAASPVDMLMDYFYNTGVSPEQRLQESAEGGLYGMGAELGLGGLYRVGKGVVSGGKRLVSAIGDYLGPQTKEGAETLVGQELSKMTSRQELEAAQQLRTQLQQKNVPTDSLTTSDLTQNQQLQIMQSLASKERGAQSNVAFALKAKKAVEDINATARNLAGEAIDVNPVERGKSITNLLETSRKAQKKAANALYEDKSVRDIYVKPDALKGKAEQLYKQFYTRKEVGQPLSPNAELTNEYDNLLNFAEGVKTPTQDIKPGANLPENVGTLHDFRSKFRELARQAPANSPDEAFANALANKIDNLIEKTPGTEKLQEAKEEWKNYISTWFRDANNKTPLLGQALKKQSPEEVAAFISKNSQVASDFEKLVGGVNPLKLAGEMEEFIAQPDINLKLKWIESKKALYNKSPIWSVLQDWKDYLTKIKQTEEVGAISNLGPENVNAQAKSLVRALGGVERVAITEAGEQTGTSQAKNIARSRLTAGLGTTGAAIGGLIGNVPGAIAGGTATIAGALAFDKITRTKIGQSNELVGKALQRALMDEGEALKFLDLAEKVGAEEAAKATANKALQQQYDILMKEGRRVVQGKVASGYNEYNFEPLNQPTATPSPRPSLITPLTTSAPAMVEPTSSPTPTAALNATPVSEISFIPYKIKKGTVQIPTGPGLPEPKLIKAVIEAESSRDPLAISKAGARGLMQLIGSTAKEMGVDPTDPQENVVGGAVYLQENLDRFGDTKLALAAYNMGPNGLKKYMKQSKATTWEQLLAADKRGKIDLPEETKNYVKKVMNLMER